MQPPPRSGVGTKGDRTAFIELVNRIFRPPGQIQAPLGFGLGCIVTEHVAGQHSGLNNSSILNFSATPNKKSSCGERLPAGLAVDADLLSITHAPKSRLGPHRRKLHVKESERGAPTSRQAACAASWTRPSPRPPNRWIWLVGYGGTSYRIPRSAHSPRVVGAYILDSGRHAVRPDINKEEL